MRPVMRFTLLCASAVLGSSCAGAVASPGNSAGQESARAAAAVETFREHCEAFESLDFGTRRAARLRGHAWVSYDADREPLQGVQVAARSLATGGLQHVMSGPDGSFDVAGLPAGDYDVWTCLDGFDELRFRLTVDPQSATVAIDLFIGPSEAPGRRDVIEKEAGPPPGA